jgi:alkanesulfonate monooxygenase SsuD/methylene tetrahydromethanopterin reductase-like flavin-dependent oxidoreductase (luciferase family)
MIERLEYVASIGFDWASLSEHHYSPRILTPSPIVSAADVEAKVKYLKIAPLGPIVPQANPICIAEELAMVDTVSQGPLVVGLLRGRTDDYLGFDLNPAEGRERTDEGMELILPSRNPSAGRDAITSTAPSPSGRARCGNRTPRPTRSAPASSRATSRPATIWGSAFPTSRSRPWRNRPTTTGGNAVNMTGSRGPTASSTAPTCCSPKPTTRRTNASRNNRGQPFPMRPALREARQANVNGVLPVTFVGGPDTVVGQITKRREVVGAGVLDLSLTSPGSGDLSALMDAISSCSAKPC